MKTLIFSAADIRQITLQVGLDSLMDEVIDGLTRAFDGFDAARAVIPERQGFVYSHPTMGLLEWMPCMATGGRAAIKVVGYHPENARSRNLPTILATVSAYDTDTGHLACLMDGTFLTALRTGAASAVATRLMASPGSETLGLIGTGAQAVSQLHAISRVLDVRRVLVYDLDPRVQRSFATRVESILGQYDIEPASLEEIVEQADVICTATSIGVGEGPLFDGVEPKPWAHFNAVGSDFTGKMELPASLLRRSFVSPDVRDQAVKEGECQQLAPEEIGPSLWEVVQRRQEFRKLPERLTVFDSTGWALEDQVTLEILLAHARRLGVGTNLAIETLSRDALNPYQFVFEPEAARVQVRLPEPVLS